MTGPGAAGRPGRVAAIDPGSRRIGVAVSDDERRMAVPHATFERSGDDERDLAALAELLAEAGVRLVVVGLPLHLDGRRGPAAREAGAFADRLARLTGLEVETWDERLTTTEATRRLDEAGVRGRRRRRVVDAVAATVILQSWLDAHRSGAGIPPGGELR